MLTDAEFAQMRAVEEETMIELADIVHTALVSDGALGQTAVETVQEDVPCKRWARLSGEGEKLFGGQLVEGLMWMMAFPVGTQIASDDQVRMADGSATYNVTSVMAEETYETARYVIVSKR